MNNTSTNTTSWSTNTQRGDNKPHVMLQILFGFIALLAFCGNGLLCIVILRRRRFLRSSYNLVIFSLAVTDMLTGLFIAGTPGYIIGLSSYPVPSGIGGEMFCRLISTQYFVFVFGKVSVLTIVALALERWYSVVKPIEYKIKFTRKRIYIYVAIIWLISGIANGSKPIKAKLSESSLRCTWSKMPYPKNIFIPSYTTVTFFIPTAITWLSFLHVGRVLKRSPAEQNVRFRNTRKKLTRMCAIVAFLLTMNWLPNQVFYTLSAFDITKAETPLHHFTIVLAMFNSCVNPWICYFTNREYKKGFRQLLCFGRKKVHSRQSHFYSVAGGSERSDVTGRTDLSDGVLHVLSFKYINSGFTNDNKVNNVEMELNSYSTS
ncbi:hypothetical protein OS493_029765 [Desmophyllum pertusum]|uniref:G-protein coupled receptors family 1 profile domain-containing protein n=1 Tax=Desmophyllum pertusum TaxID=174260 RepID=A0A9W9YWQ2_9CNID|nr:hypothetical protein OS493_029765 [Desmophyllum pertusum]